MKQQELTIKASEFLRQVEAGETFEGQVKYLMRGLKRLGGPEPWAPVIHPFKRETLRADGTIVKWVAGVEFAGEPEVYIDAGDVAIKHWDDIAWRIPRTGREIVMAGPKGILEEESVPVDVYFKALHARRKEALDRKRARLTLKQK